MRGLRHNSGAALVIVLAIMTILLAIGLTFYAVSRLELRTATNVTNTVRVDLLSDAAVAIAIAHLNQDFFNHPEATSTDHAWKSLFNGSWIAGKPAFWRRNTFGTAIPIEAGGVPEIDLNRYPYIDFYDDGLGNREPLYRSLRTRDWLTIPRIEADNAGNGLPVIYAAEGTYDLYATSTSTTPLTQLGFPHQSFSLEDLARAPFVLPNFCRYSTVSGQLTATYPVQEIDALTDVDNDGDLLKDAIWIPLPGDIYFPDDLMDNDLNGVQDNDGSELGVEAGVFVYWGGDDGLDNNGNGLVDDQDPVERDDIQGWFLTSPLLGLEIPVDLDSNGIVGDAGDFLDGIPARVRIPDTMTIEVGSGSAAVTVTLTPANVDTLDNDYDLLINDHFFYAYLGPGPGDDPDNDRYQNWLNTVDWRGEELARFSVALGLAYSDIDLELYFPGLYFNPFPGYPALEKRLRITHSGEPVCDLVGRAAILITDESSKVNLNAAGGHTYPDILASVDPPVRSIGRIPVPGLANFFTAPSAGAGVFEYETRILPKLDAGKSRNLWETLTGVPKRTGNLTPEYVLDTIYPGYGRADDDGNALLLAMNQRDDDGDGFVDEGLYLPNINDPTFPIYRRLLGALEGIDEPTELQRFAATRNLVAEGVAPGPKPARDQDQIDNDLDGVVNELGELGDQQYQNMRQIPTITNGVADDSFDDFGPYSTVFSTDRAVNYAVTSTGIRGVNRIDYNLATPQQIAANLMAHGDFTPVTTRLEPHPLNPTQVTPFVPAGPSQMRDGARHVIINDFVMGLRQADVHVSAPSAQPGYKGGFLHYFDPSASQIYPATLGPSNLTAAQGNDFGTQNGMHLLPADRQLQAMQASANIVDFRDGDHRRSTLTTENFNVASDAAELNRVSPWPTSLNKREVIEEEEFLPLEEIEQQINSTLDAGKSLQAVDDWLMQDVGGEPLVKGASGLPEQRHISYSVAGDEAIKINELMVRPVRRVEAEAAPNAVLVGATDPIASNATYNIAPRNFDPTPFGNTYPLAGTQARDVLPEFDVRRRTLGRALESGNALSVWTIEGGLLGENSAAATTSGSFPYTRPGINDTYELPNVIEFVFVPPPAGVLNGMPSGRYYLTLNMLAGLVPTIYQGGQLEYSIKYVTMNADGSIGSPTIIDDLMTTLNSLPVGAPFDAVKTGYYDLVWAQVPDAHIALKPGQAPGWVFLDGTPNPATHPEGVVDPAAFTTMPGYFTDGGGDFGVPGAGALQTHTVAMPLPGHALCVALRVDPTAFSTPVAVSANFFDFSQEPDHEWVELVNVSQQAVDLGLWQLEAGIPDIDGIVPDRYKRLWEIPEGTTIAPGGTLLLCANKLDVYWSPNGTFGEQTRNAFNGNGIGLAASNALPEAPASLPIQNITVPEVFSDTSPTLVVFPLTNPMPDPLADLTGNVFRRNLTPGFGVTDYVDRDGDGRTSYAVRTVTDSDATIIENTQIQSSNSASMALLTSRGAEQPFDRIVEMRSLIFSLDDNDTPYNPADDTLVPMTRMTDVDDVANVVLRGGMLPNYPEHDGVDNDGDGAYWLTGYTPVQGLLDADMVDNNLDGFIDEQFSQILISGTLFTDLSTSEGVDEGRSVGTRAYSRATTPYVFYRDRLNHVPSLTAMASLPTPVNGIPTDPTYGFYEPGDLAVTQAAVAVAGDPLDPFTNLNAQYIGSSYDPPEWKAFTHRRWYPGDDVIVTLYQGPAKPENVVDRVTYTEQDVTNRTIDDVQPCPYVFAGYHGLGVGGDLDDTPSLNFGYPTMWLPDQMGLDFYRSLERKNPHARGDRFGTRNRWQATDGNYDDWAESPSLFYNVVSNRDAAGNPSWPPAFQQKRTRDLNPLVNAQEAQLYAHAIFGSPLRENLAHRISDNPTDLETADNQFRFVRDFPDGASKFVNGVLKYADGSSDIANLQWTMGVYPDAPPYTTVERLPIADRPFKTVGELMTLPLPTYEQRMVNTAATIPANDVVVASRRFVYDLTKMNFEFVPPGALLPGVTVRQDISVRGVAMGQDQTDARADKDLLTAAVDSMASDSVVLTVAQATFTPIRPFSDVVGRDIDLLDWDPQVTPPGVWAPLYLFTSTSSVGDDEPVYPQYADGTSAASVNPSAKIPLNSLLSTSFLLGSAAFTGGLNEATLINRYSLNHRTVMYVSAYNPSAFSTRPAPRDEEETNGRPQALFEWGPEDGLENGEYVVYIGTYLPGLSGRLAAANVALAANGSPNLSNGPQAFDKLQRMGTNQLLTIEVITDPTRGRGQQGLNASSEDPGLVHPKNWNAKTYTPNSDGYILYGDASVGSWRPQLVHVSSNYLAVRVRNDGQQGQIGAITHVVLAPRKRIPGKINLNTVDNHPRMADVPPDNVRHSFFNTIMGLPSVVDASGLESSIAIAGITQPKVDPPPTPTDIAQAYDPVAVVPPLLWPGPEFLDNFSAEPHAARLQLTSMIAMARPEHVDGRYYTSIADLTRDAMEFPNPDPVAPPGNTAFPLSNAALDETRFDQVSARFQRLANLISVRSDVFEIIATVQSGYGVDADNDGRFNYRSDEEFVTTAETKARVVYERRSAPDRTDQPAR